MSKLKRHAAGVWEQGKGFVRWSKHSSAELARAAAMLYARRLENGGLAAGGVLSWAGGYTDENGALRWVDGQGHDKDEA